MVEECTKRSVRRVKWSGAGGGKKGPSPPPNHTKSPRHIAAPNILIDPFSLNLFSFPLYISPPISIQQHGYQ